MLADEDFGVFDDVAIGARLGVGLRLSGEKIRVRHTARRALREQKFPGFRRCEFFLRRVLVAAFVESVSQFEERSGKQKFGAIVCQELRFDVSELVKRQHPGMDKAVQIDRFFVLQLGYRHVIRVENGRHETGGGRHREREKRVHHIRILLQIEKHSVALMNGEIAEVFRLSRKKTGKEQVLRQRFRILFLPGRRFALGFFKFLLEISQTREFRFRRTGADLQVNEVRFREGKTELVADFLGFGARCDEVAGLIDQLGI